MKFELNQYNRNPDPQEVLADIKNTANKLNKSTLTTAEYKEHGRWHPDTPIRLFNKWNYALEQAGLEIKKRMNISDEDLYLNLNTIWIHLGRQPHTSDMVKPTSKFDLSVYKRRFKSWRNALEAFITFVNENSENDSAALATLNSGTQIQPIKTVTRSAGWRMRFLVMKRDCFKCRQCGSSPSTDNKVVLVIDHVIPYSKGGLTTVENLQTLCEMCNGGKSNLT